MGAVRRLAMAVLALLLTAIAACAPVEGSAGPQVATPALHGTAILAADGAELPVRTWQPDATPPRAVILALHGFNDYSNFFDSVGHWLAQRGIASYAYDQRGFGAAPGRGLWPGTATLESDLRSAVAAIRAHHPGVPLYVFGESMGGAVVMVTMADVDAPKVDGIILSAPAVWGRASMPWYQTTVLWIAANTYPWGHLTGRGLGIRPSDNTEMLMALGRDPLVIKETRIDAVYGLVNLMDAAMLAAPRLDGPPMLILYGERDQLIPAGAFYEMLQRLPPDGADRRRIIFYASGYHMLTRDLEAETVWRDIDAWIERTATTPRPASADTHTADTDNGATTPADSSRIGDAPENAGSTGDAPTACPQRTGCAIVPDRHS